MLTFMPGTRKSILTGEPPRPSVASVPAAELRERLARANAALAAVKRAPQTKAARVLAEELKQEVQTLERDLA